MANDWDCVILGTELGPMPFPDLAKLARDGHLARTDPVRRSPAGDWTPAAQISGLFPVSAARGSVVASGNRTATVSTSKVASSPIARQIQASPTQNDEGEGISKRMLAALWGSAGVAVIVAVAFMLYSRSLDRAKVNAANNELATAITGAQTWISTNGTADQGESIERQLTTALENGYVSDKPSGERVMNEVRQRREQLTEQARTAQAEKRATAIFADAKAKLDKQQAKEAIALLENYVLDPHATERTEAQRLLAEARIAMSDKVAFEAMIAMDDDAFASMKATGVIDDGKVTFSALVAVRKETIGRNMDKAAERRGEIKIADERRREAETMEALKREQQEEKRRLAADRRARAEKRLRQAEKPKPIADASPAVKAYIATAKRCRDYDMTRCEQILAAKPVRYPNRMTRKEQLQIQAEAKECYVSSYLSLNVERWLSGGLAKAR